MVVKKGRNIKVILSMGSEKVIVPNIVEESFYKIQDILKKNGLRVGKLTKVYHQFIPQDHVIAQVPLQHARANRGSEVNLLISKGNQKKIFIMPDFVGKDLDAVTVFLKDLGLYLGKIRYELYEDLDENIIINQEPKSGYKVEIGQKVDLIVSQKKIVKEEDSQYKFKYKGSDSN